ncbi:hypothetical protein [Alteromonas gracilis]
MNDEQEQLYREGYAAFLEGVEEHSNPYSNLDAEYWSDGWEDAKDDQVGQ